VSNFILHFECKQGANLLDTLNEAVTLCKKLKVDSVVFVFNGVEIVVTESTKIADIDNSFGEKTQKKKSKVFEDTLGTLLDK
jgi:hypothetical protein